VVVAKVAVTPVPIVLPIPISGVSASTFPSVCCIFILFKATVLILITPAGKV
jgi:hypothetical protein